MSGENFGGGWGNSVPGYDGEVWQRIMNEAMGQMGQFDKQDEAAETENVATEEVSSESANPEAVNVEFSSQRDDVAPAERHQADLDAKFAAQNEVLMRQSEEEMAAFERKLEMSPEAYWQELKNEYALQGVNLGLMPDVRGMREYAAEYLAENAGEGDQTARIGIAIKTELDKMAQSKSEEIQKWQSEGRGLPVTFEGEWIEAGQRDMKNLLSEYYGAEGEFGEQAKNGGALTDDEKVGWQMASLPQKPGTLNPVFVVKNYAGRFEGETVPEYYNRLKNYRKQDQMREWQIRQDQGKQVVDRGEEPVGEAEVAPKGDVAERRAALEELGVDPKSKVYTLGDRAFMTEEPVTGNMKVIAAAETEEEKKSREVEEAIRETDIEVERMRQEREAKARAAMVLEIVKEPRFKMAVGRLVLRFLDAMRLEDTTEEEAYYAEMERQEKGKQQKGFDAELWAATDKSGLPPVFEDEQVAGEERVVEEEQEEVTPDVDNVVEKLTPEKARQVVATMKKAEEMLRREDLSEEVRKSIETSYARMKAILEKYQDLRERKGEYYFDWLRSRKLISGEMGERGLAELEALQEETKNGLADAAWDGDEVALDEFFERTKAIRQAMEWLERLPRKELDVIPVDGSMGETVDEMNADAGEAVA